MKKQYLLLSLLALMFGLGCQQPGTNATEVEANQTEEQEPQRAEYAIAIHGGAGTILRENMSAEKEAEFEKRLNEALDIGEAILKAGGTSMDAVEKTIIHLENSPLFNAGKGAVYTSEGKHELDASIMDGRDLNAGAVGGITNVKNPILAARAVLERSEHVMLTGKGAEQFAIENGLETVENSYFDTEFRLKALEQAKAVEDKRTGFEFQNPDYKFGTVGCAALDKDGNLAAGTSTGGMTNKRYNRIGDSPIIGSGVYANNATCALSSTGHGEFFIRWVVGHDISALMEYKGLSLAEAGDEVIRKKLKEAGGSGGVIAVDKYGNVAMPFNTPGMYRGYSKPGERVVRIYED